MSRRVAIFAAATCLVLSAASRAAEPEGEGLAFLLGEWDGSGSGQPGRGAGSFSFAPELEGQVLVRRAHSEYPATAGRPAVVHDDLMVVYAEQSKAIYFDNEGHVIHYAITTDAKARTAIFLSVDPAPSPGFRLTYRQAAPDRLGVTFEISPSGTAGEFAPYLTGTATRHQPPGS